MNSPELQNLYEAYINVYEADGLLGSLDNAARTAAGKVGEVIGREKAKNVPGANIPIIGGVIKKEGERRGRDQGQQMYDKAKETVGSFLKQDYEPDLFDIVLEYLVTEGYADTNKNALVIMAHMSEDWKQSICEEQKRKLKDILGPGVPSEPPSSTTSLRSLARRTTSDKAKPKGSNSGIPTVPLNQSSYRGRIEAGRDPRKQYSDNPDYTGPLTRGAGSGTKDRMPGTTPSSNPHLSPQTQKNKSIPKSTPNYSNFI